ncbi:GMC family oxidoreductase [Pseudomonas syringae]|uniref:GMC family oxidoreductase n=1 Tax=Pseudomonas syringae TaxID=317 RepID=UPI001F2C8EA5|nr:GMC family oxidoreductase N-terminal domain-containing protein [Pseudomonas syringae]MCF5724124.1 choline dehydrogenase [Pseudomonas syringae]
MQTRFAQQHYTLITIAKKGAKLTQSDQTADFIVVGAGSAGCTLAARLSEDPNTQVLLLEAGGFSRDPWLNIPIGYAKTVGNPKHDWGFMSEPEPALNDRPIPCPRGLGVGGSSLINGMLYVRGHQRDYDQWEAQGCEGWGWDSMLKYFEKSMHYSSANLATSTSPNPLWITDLPKDKVSDAFVASAARVGITPTNDFNAGNNFGAGYYRMNVRSGKRMSGYTAYLKPIANRKNLRILTECTAAHVVFEGTKAVGVEILAENETKTLRARREVILAAGAIQSPAILQRSGVGPAALLESLGIPVLVDSAGVGANLQDHLQIRLTYECQGIKTLNELSHSSLLGAIEGVRYTLFRTGALATAVHRAGAFFNVLSQPDWPDTQIHMALLSFDRRKEPLHSFPGITLSGCNLRPSSRGHVSIASRDPKRPPLIKFNYLETSQDKEHAIAMVRKIRTIAANEPLASLIKREHAPSLERESDEEIFNWIKQTASSIFHPVGTCSMANTKDSPAVLDSRLKVNGVNSLRVVDGSVMPELVSGNTNAPIIAIAEKAADLIREDWA